jgi:hypothetical protein
MEKAIALSLKSRLKSAQIAFDGFPWKLATILYTLSWGWPLLRPNTLYWDDWAFIWGQPKNYLNEIFVDTGLPPWRALLDQQLISVGYWTIQSLTFLMFFGAGLCLFLILQKIQFLNIQQKQLIAVMFLIIPINHSRIALVLFGYTTSYFLFFLAWCLLIRSRSLLFIGSLTLFFWSFMTHSFLFLYVLPVAHFFILNFANKSLAFRNRILIIKTSVLLALPLAYYALRSEFWYPTPEWDGYHRFTIDGASKILPLLVIGALAIWVLWVSLRRNVPKTLGLKMMLLGWLLFTWGLFPYFANGRIPDYVSIFAVRSDWGGRHIMLTPLGASIIIAGALEITSKNIKRYLLAFCYTIFIGFNVFCGIQIYLDSLKKEQLTELIAKAGDAEEIKPNNRIIFLDETKIFNSRFSTYRDPELRAKLITAGIAAQSITGKVDCSSGEGDLEVKLKSNKSFLDVSLSGDLGLYLEISACSP